ncbi:DUF456 domain-containing protein [Nocardioides sp. JQ2195]|uniref:DUF456 domain-containing protein n=1 Tax=Nocardioides sp. JQ2195 TaxID=2592334 RepID=UPI00143E60E2|nr:DUF456 domain-containing protein [Nocardioides sp. JQ2195]QIX26441.1 DUF456 domain-containing protein [Nocardioides sp. JQ2195]
MTLVDVIAALAIAIGLVGIIFPALPGSLLILAAALVWAVQVDQGAGWVVFAVITALLAAGSIVKYTVPGKGMRRAGVPGSTLALGAVLGVIGFFVIPVLGLVVGFVVGVYAAEVRRVGQVAARRTTMTALKAVGVSILIELAAGMLAALTFAVGVVVT